MNKYVLILFTTILFSGCEKIDPDTPGCIQDKIREFSTSPIVCDEGANVSMWLFQEQNVYVFNPGNCGADMSSSVYGEDCTYLGYLGGFAGNTEINGVDFSAAADFIKYVWEKQ